MASLSHLQHCLVFAAPHFRNSILALQHHTFPPKPTTNSLFAMPIKIQSLHKDKDRVRFPPSFAMSKGGTHLNFDDDYSQDQDPFWLAFFNETIRGFKSMFAFLIDQPAQLNHLEWPSFQDTLRTATLTLVLVAMLIVALSSIDSALSFVLAFLMRRPA